MSLVSDLINEAFDDLGVTKPGEVVSTTIQAAAFLKFQQMWRSMSNDPALAYVGRTAIGTPVAGAFQLILGPSGSGGFNTSAIVPVRVLGWSSASGSFRNGGQILPMAQLHALAKNGIGRRSVLAEAVGADVGVPGFGINVEIFPTPDVSPGTLELDYYSTVQPFATVGDVVNLPDGYERFLHLSLAIELAPQYARQGGVPEALAADVADARNKIMAKNAAILGLVPQQAPQQQGPPPQGQ